MSSFHQYNAIASNVVPLILALFLGSWSDRRGRKLPLLLGMAGQTYYFAMLAVVASQGEMRSLGLRLGPRSRPRQSVASSGSRLKQPQVTRAN